MILCLGTTPAVQRVMVFPKLALDAVNRATTTLDGVAGKSINVAKVLQALGERPVAVGFLGGNRGEYLRAVLAERGLDHEFVTVRSRTRQCVTLIDQSAGTVTELVEESSGVDRSETEKLMNVVRHRLNGCRALVMSGTIAPGVSADFYLQCARLAQEFRALVVVDAQGAALVETLKARPGLVKPNRLELAATIGRELPEEKAVTQAMRELHERGAERIVVTAGMDPALAFDGRTFWRVAAPRVAAINPIGSGDAFAAGAVWRLLRGDDLGEACRWGCAAGAANALTALAGEVNRADVERLAREVILDRI